MSFAEFIYTEVLKPRPLKTLTNAILLRIIPEHLRVGPATLYLNPNDPVVSGALTLRVFEPSELAFFQKYCRGEMTLLDIGANIGLYTALGMHQLDRGGRIIAFEPHPTAFHFLQKNIAANQSQGGACPRVDALNLAAASENASLELRLNPENQADNRLYHGTYQGKVEQWKSVPVQARVADEVLDEMGVVEVNFVKIDIQGYEHKAVSGLQRTLARSRQVILMSEFWPKGLWESGGNPRRYLELLSALGFRLYELRERPRAKVIPLGDQEALIQRLSGRKYTNIIGVKGYNLQP